MDQDGKWLLCRLGNVWYGLDLSQVQEIVYKPVLTSLPALGRAVAGIMDWLGREITVVDITGVGREGQPVPDIAEGQKQVIVLKAGPAPAGGEAAIGLLTDEIGEIIPKQVGSKIEIDPLLRATIKAVDSAFEYNDEIIFALNYQELYRAIA